MATSNFHNVNATHIFAVQLEDEWAYEDLVYNLESEFNVHNDYSDYGKTDPDELRSFPSRSLGSFSDSLTIGEDEVEIFITPVIRSGYYDGCNFKYFISWVYFRTIKNITSKIVSNPTYKFLIKK